MMDIGCTESIGVSKNAEFVQRRTCLNCGCDELTVQSSGRFDEGALASHIATDSWGENPSPYLRGKSWVLVQCNRCKLRFHQNILTPEWNEVRFSRWMSGQALQEFEEKHGRTDRFERGTYFSRHVIAIRKLLKSSRRDSDIKVLDFGSGNGEYLAVATAFGFEAHGVDRSAARRENSKHVRVHETLEEAAKQGPYDVVSLFEVLEHVDDPRGLLVALRQLMKDDALLIVETPDCTGIFSMDKESRYRAIHPLDHINVFEPATLRAMVERVGFHAIKRPVVFCTASVATATKKLGRSLLGKSDGSGTQIYFRKESGH